MDHIDATFTHPIDPSAVLFLVENTGFRTRLSLHSLRDSYLLMVLEAVCRNKSPALAKVFWMSTSDLHPLEIPAGSPITHRQLLQDYANLTNDCRGFATPASVVSAIESLLTTFNGVAAIRHLVIFAGFGPGFPTLYDTVSWSHAIHLLKEEDVRVHLITPAQYTGSLTTFYRGLIDGGSIFQSFTDGNFFSFHLTATSGLIGTAPPELVFEPRAIPEADRVIPYLSTSTVAPPPRAEFSLPLAEDDRG